MKSFAVVVSATLALAAGPPAVPPSLPATYTASYTTGTTTTRQYSDGNFKKLAIFVDSTSGTQYTVTDCNVRLTYSNAPQVDYPNSKLGQCTLTPPNPFYDQSGCPSVHVPAWPPATTDFYSSFRPFLTYTRDARCPLSKGMCYQYTHVTTNTKLDFYVNKATLLPDSGTVVVKGLTYQHTFHNDTVDQKFLGPQPDCPDPSGDCGTCFTGVCATCQICQQKSPQGGCAPCWVKDQTTGKSCMSKDPSTDLCTKCWQPAAPTPPPTPVPAKDTCGGPCASMGLSGMCCPSATGVYLSCCDHKNTTKTNLLSEEAQL